MRFLLLNEKVQEVVARVENQYLHRKLAASFS